MPSKIAFYFESGQIAEIGTGHKYRAESISKELKKRGHEILFIGKEDSLDDIKILVIDHLYSQRDLLLRAKNLGIKTVLIDGASEDVFLSDLSISVFYNRSAWHKGLDYIAFPAQNDGCFDKYAYDEKNKAVFVGMGGYDKNNYTELVLGVLTKLNLNVVVAPSINIEATVEKFKDNKNINFWNDKDYYGAMKKCMMAVTSGGLTMFQSMCFGLPCVCIPQYEHQKDNINFVKSFCLPAEPNEKSIEENVKKLITNKHLCLNLSDLARLNIKNDGTVKICDLIGSLIGFKND